MSKHAPNFLGDKNMDCFQRSINVNLIYCPSSNFFQFLISKSQQQNFERTTNFYNENGLIFFQVSYISLSLHWLFYSVSFTRF